MKAANPYMPLVRADDRTAFMLGNGPSLASVSLPSLSSYATVGFNAAYRYWREIDWRPRYYACLDLVVGVSHKDAIIDLLAERRIEQFLLRNNLIEVMGSAAQDPRIVNFDELREREPLLSCDPITTGSHAALWAASMGYETIVLLGVDAQYKEIVAGARRRDGIELEIVEDQDNPNYFFKGYQAPGDRYNLPNPRPDLHVNAWRLAGVWLARAGVRVFNANRASAVRCFSFIEIEPFMAEGAKPEPAGEALPEPAVEKPTMPGTARQRLGSFASAYAGKIIALMAMAGIFFALWVLTAKPSQMVAIAAAIAGAAAVSGLLVLAYARSTILNHLHRQDEKLAALRARVAELERFAERRQRGSPSPKHTA